MEVVSPSAFPSPQRTRTHGRGPTRKNARHALASCPSTGRIPFPPTRRPRNTMRLAPLPLSSPWPPPRRAARRRLQAQPPLPRRGRRQVQRRHQGADVARQEDGDHRLRHVGRAPLPERRPPRRGDGPADERGADEGPRAGRADHSRPAAAAWTPYKDHPARKLAPGAPRRPRTCPTDIGEWCQQIPAEEKGKYPIDQTDGGEDDDPAEHASLARQAQGDGPQSRRRRGRAQIDAARRSTTRTPSATRGVEIWNLLEAARHQQRHPPRRAHEHVRARPAVRPAADGQERQERRADARHDRHDVQPGKLARTSATSRAPT